MTALLLVDLDNTLFSARTIPQAVLAPAHAAARAANAAARAPLSDARIEAVLDAAWDRPFDEVARAYGLPAALTAAWQAAMANVEVVGPIAPYPDVPALAALPGRRVLVTTGYARFQRSKVAALGVGPLFERVVVDALDAAGRPGKAAIFRALLAECGADAREALVVGDSAASELAAGRALGIPTVQVLRPGVARDPDAAYHVPDLRALGGVLAAVRAAVA